MFTTTVTGEDRVLSRLKYFDKEAWKELQAGVKAGGEVIAASGRGLIPFQPTSGWSANGRLGWNQSSAQGSVKARFRSRTRGGVTGVQATVGMTNAAAAVWALAGSKSSTQFSDLLTAMYGPAGRGTGSRALSPAWRMNIEKVRDQIQDAIDRAVRRASL